MNYLTLHIRILLAMTLITLGFTGCDRSAGERELAKLTNNIKDLVDDVTPSKEVAQQEVEKLFILEYEVLTFPSDVKATDLESALRRAGAERWDCFHVESRADQLLVLCKRHPKTYLRYIPRVF